MNSRTVQDEQPLSPLLVTAQYPHNVTKEGAIFNLALLIVVRPRDPIEL